MDHLDVYTPREHVSKFHEFLRDYWIMGYSVCWDNRKLLPNQDERMCRYCGRRMPEVTFETDAHIFPNSMGNQYFLSEEECDHCNNTFSVYESDLARYMGMSRTFNGFADKLSVPKYVSANAEVKAHVAPFMNIKRGLHIEQTNIENGNLSVDMDAGKGSWKYKKRPYRPQYVYKSLLKMAMSILPEELRKDYNNAFPYLINKNRFSKHLPEMMVYTLPVSNTVRAPFAMLFQRRKESPKHFPHLLCMVLLEHFAFHFILPFSDSDRQNATTEKLTFTACPPINFYPQFLDAKVGIAKVNLSSIDLVRDEPGCVEFEFTLNKDELVGIDPVTGKEVDIDRDPAKLKGMIMTIGDQLSIPIKKD